MLEAEHGPGLFRDLKHLGFAGGLRGLAFQVNTISALGQRPQVDGPSDVIVQGMAQNLEGHVSQYRFEVLVDLDLPVCNGLDYVDEPKRYWMPYRRSAFDPEQPLGFG